MAKRKKQKKKKIKHIDYSKFNRRFAQIYGLYFFILLAFLTSDLHWSKVNKISRFFKVILNDNYDYTWFVIAAFIGAYGIFIS